ncbi:acetate--CoA ligase family protein [Rhodoplanes sp. Z2-YC6860]|uniref:acetate--CoA ligase family protein n=1 Tax=Rhodoplanes sp. Z2-YC6860 TaxID=674703 RepID=UPI00078CE602|nr:acetate--CoA ligase family protein [Rhodoplanes sp. Z2-YC6860]AMN39296.1 CoA-binding domain-containing protein [Rhodoplanes sp. Z2-YC6860]
MTKPLAQVLLAPQSVAIIGQSNDATKTAGRPLKYLRQAGYAGRIYPINPRRDEVLGERAWPSLAELPELPDHAYIVASTDATMEAIEECARLGVPVVTALANGFSETGAEGTAREARIKAIIQQTGTRLVGPSSLGVVDLRHKAFMTANAAFDEPDLPVGRIFAASHSGGMIGTFLSRGKARGIHFAGLVSVGNEVDLSIGEICAATLDDPGIDGYVLFLETMRKAETLRAFALEAAKRGKSVLAYKLGRSAAARELAVSHTGALAGEDDIAGMFLAECGIARVDTLEGLIEGFPLLARVPAPARGARPPAVAVVTTTAGGATMVIDPLSVRGIEVRQPTPQTLARLKEATGVDVAPARLIDLTLAGAQYKVMKGALDVLTTAPEYDLIVVTVGSSARFYPDLAVKPIIDSAGAAKPIAAFLVPEAPDALARLAAAGVPNFHTPEACADAVTAALRRRAPQVTEVRPGRPSGSGRMLDELEAYGLFDKLGLPHAPSLALDASIAKVAALPFAYPVVVKALSEKIAHKSDVGGVVLNVRDDTSLLAAIAKIREATHVDRVLVQPMVSGLGEVLIGYRIDRDVGPTVMLAAGGVLAEILRDRSIRLAPVDLAEAKAMIGEVMALKALAGYRGKEPGDLDGLAHALVSLSRLAVHDGPVVAEAEINPLIVRPKGQGVVAVDALVKLV